MNSLEEIREILMSSNNILIAGHVNPDGDCIGACFGLGLALKKAGKQVWVSLEKYNKKFHVIPGNELVAECPAGITPGLFAALDCADKQRIGGAVEAFAKAPVTVCIDHHATNTGLADYNFIMPNASSTSELIYHLVQGITEIDKDIAGAIYAGIVYDTGGFRHGCTGSETYRIAGELLKTGIDFTTIYNELMYRHSYTETKIFTRALVNLTVRDDCPVVYSYVSREDLKETGATGQDLDGTVEYLLNIRGIEVSFFVYEKNNKQVKVSFRSKGKNVGGIAAAFGGGGHHNAAGCTLDDSIDSAVAKVISILKREFVNE